MQATYIDHMGTDLTVVNAARVSMGKRSEWDFSHPSAFGTLKEKDAKLIKYLAEHNHTTPFRHCYVTLHMKAPFFVRNQLLRHTIGFSVNEISRRYVDSSPEFYVPSEWRERAENVKQGSGDNCPSPDQESFTRMVRYTVNEALEVYTHLINGNVAPEQARVVLPMNVYTEWYWTGSLQGWAELCKQRLAPDAQKETREITQQIEQIVQNLYPVSWEALKEWL